MLREATSKTREDWDIHSRKRAQALLGRILERYSFSGDVSSWQVAVNSEFVPSTTVIREHDEVAFHSPHGRRMTMPVSLECRVQQDPIDPLALARSAPSFLSGNAPECGCCVNFLGTVRIENEGRESNGSNTNVTKTWPCANSTASLKSASHAFL